MVANITAGPALYQLANDQVLIWWEVDQDDGSNRIEWYKSAMAPLSVPAATTAVTTETGSLRYVNKVYLRDLTPGTRHYFRIFAADFATPPHIPYIFTTYKDDGTSIRLGVWGNSEFNNGATVPGLGASLDALDSFGVAGYLTVGGITGSGASHANWQSWYDVIGARLQTKGLTGVRGESDGFTFMAKAMYPVGYLSPSYFAHTIGKARIVGLNSLAGYPRRDLRPGREQYSWMLNEIQSPQWKNALYRVICVHHPFRTTFWNDTGIYGDNGTIVELRDTLHELVKISGPDLVLYGYSRSYQRGSYESKYSNNPQDIQHVVTGGGGAWKHSNSAFSWTQPQEPGIVFDSSNYIVLTLDISSTRLQLDAHDLETGEVVDTVSIAPHSLY